MKYSQYKNLDLLIYSILASLIFWNVVGIDNRISGENFDHITNLMKYSEKFEFISLNYIFENPKDFGYYLVTLFAKKIGLTFEVFLFILISLNFFLFTSLFYQITGTKKLFFYIILYCLLSIWMQGLFGAILRQAMANMLLIYFFFYKNNFNNYKLIFFFFIILSIHFSAIIFLFFILFEKYFYNKNFILDLIFSFLFLLYILDLNVYFTYLVLDIANLFDISLRSLDNLNHPTSGFTVKKSIAILLPIILFRITIYIENEKDFQKNRFYLFYLYVCTIGIILSQMSYYDRILMYAWHLSPILLVYSFYIFTKKYKIIN